MVVPAGSIPSAEQVLERVAWPGAQPSLHREGEGPKAQVLKGKVVKDNPSGSI